MIRKAILMPLSFFNFDICTRGGLLRDIELILEIDRFSKISIRTDFGSNISKSFVNLSIRYSEYSDISWEQAVSVLSTI